MAAPDVLYNPLPPGELVQAWLLLMAGTLTLNWASRAGYRRLFSFLNGTAYEPRVRLGCTVISGSYVVLALSITCATLRLLCAPAGPL